MISVVKIVKVEKFTIKSKIFKVENNHEFYQLNDLS